ncbi:glucose-1-phosphate adenylyltransferase [bacterium]|nr:glucose-1-phosphate adenylyltransferase [bacterium]
MRNILAMVMAGGEGTRLYPLTRDRAKPAVPFGGKYRIIDFVLSNLVNSGIHQIFVLTQFKSQSLTEHLMGTWSFNSLAQRQFIFPLPAQMWMGKEWYQGTANAIYQNLHLFEDYEPEDVAVFGGDHIYKMDVSQMAAYHEEKDAHCTVAAIPVPVSQASQYGIIQIDDDWRIVGFQEKPASPAPIPRNEHFALASMGNYIFKRDVLESELHRDAQDAGSSHDFGRNVLPALVSGGNLFAYNFHANRVPGMRGEYNTYWRDVGAIQSYFEANMDLRRVHPMLDLYNPAWPIRSRELYLPPPKFVHNDPHTSRGTARIGRAINSVVSEGGIVSGSLVEDSVLGPKVRVHSYATVQNSILLEDVDIGEGALVRNAIIDKHVRVEPGSMIGCDRESDEKHGYTVVPSGPESWISVIPKVRRYKYAGDEGDVL